jgi:hypothetical protein
MKFLWGSAGNGALSAASATSDVKEKSQLASYCHSAYADLRSTRQPRQQISYVYTDSLQPLRFPVLQSLPREISSCCAKSHIDRGAAPYDPSTTSAARPRPSSPPKIMLGKVKTGGKAGFDKLYGWVDKLGAPVNKLSNKLGAEAFWPTTLDLESDKAARILRSFCSRCIALL